MRFGNVEYRDDDASIYIYDNKGRHYGQTRNPVDMGKGVNHFESTQHGCQALVLSENAKVQNKWKRK